MSNTTSLINTGLRICAITFALLTSTSQAASLQTTEVAYQEIAQQRLLEGVVEAINSTTVSAQTSGRVIEVQFDVDDRVNKDDIIIKISDSEQSASFIQAEAAMSGARSQLKQAQNNYNRITKLYKSQTVPKSQFDQAETALTSAKAALKTAEAALQQAEKQVEYTVVRAPYSGIVSKRHVQLGETVGTGQPLMTGYSIETLRVSIDAPEQLARQLSAQKQPMASVMIGSQRYESDQITIFPFANPSTNTVTIRVDLAAGTAGLYPGISAKVAFALKSAERIVIKESAVFNRSELVGVYVINADGNIQLRHIRTGRRTAGDQIEVLAGLKVGEQIALDPLAAIKALKAAQHKASTQAAE